MEDDKNEIKSLTEHEVHNDMSAREFLDKIAHLLVDEGVDFIQFIGNVDGKMVTFNITLQDPEDVQPPKLDS